MADIVQHCFGAPNAGGPATALKRLLEASDQSYPVVWQHGAAGGLSLTLLWRMAREIRRYRPRLVHVRGLGNEGFHAALAARLAGVPHVLVSVHGTQRDLVVGRRSLRRRIVVHLLEPATLRLATAITTVCHAAAGRSFIEPYRAKLVPPVPNGVAMPTLPDPRGQAVRHSLGIQVDRPVAVTVSRLTVEKGYGDLAAALADMEARGISLDLIVVGGGKESDAVKSLFEDLQDIRVHFVGQQSDVGPYLAAADFYVSPSWNENLSNALLEGMSYGLPAVTTDVGGHGEVMAHGGGLLVPPHDPGALATAMEGFLTNPEQRRALGREAHDVVKRHYSLQAMVSGWDQTYRRILDRRP